ncbi:hypothetical protein [Paenibacillus elgii]|uniref:hypothetical protein n=1 Tax=Paenibacillus elgii TaxID=189691 RepID=UPI00203A5CCF|nr:hypothetical protein [Paenibacillus elgii]MCM3272974.1 hypothetical protein [Paenibacillus elgii]
MNTTDTIALVNVIVTATGVVITGFFSFLVWKATKETANIAKSNYLLAEQIDQRLSSVKTNAKEIYIKEIQQNINSVLQFLFRGKLDDEIDVELYNNASKNPGVSYEQLAEYFTKDEKDRILLLWEEFNNYIKDFWTNKEGVTGKLAEGRGSIDAEIKAAELRSKFISLQTYFERNI